MAVARRRHGAHVAPLRAIAAVAGGALLLALLAFAWLVRAPLPKTNGVVQVPGVLAETLIRRDARGIPHIAASSARDAFFGQGYACAQDRLWQMDLLRREAEGTLSEIFGPATLSVDEYFRTLGLSDVAAATMRRLDPEDRALLEAYAAGVNAAAAGHELPLEFRLLRYAPDPWTPSDSFVVGLLITRSQDDNWQNLLLRADLSARAGPRAATALMDNQVTSLEEFVPGYAPAKATRAMSVSMAPVRFPWEDAPGADGPPLSERQGSNNWSVAPSRTTTGKPVLSNDTHLDHSLPSTWWIVQIEGGGFDAEGFALPGVPGVIIGHNQRIAWGVTSAAEDVEDVFVERFASPQSDMYLVRGRYVRALHRRVRIRVKGAATVRLDVLTTRHGPIVKRIGSRGLALSWTVLRDGIDLRAISLIDRARDWPSFRAGLSKFTAPTLNFGYADVDGHIGSQDAGRVPLRAAGDGSVPVEGEDDRFAWVGEVPFAELPHAFDPPRGFFASANNELVPPHFVPALSRDFLSPYRIHEIVRQLSTPGKRSPEAIGSIQGDTFDYPRSRLAAVAAKVLASSKLVSALSLLEFDDARVIELLRDWNGDASVDAQAPTFAAALDRALEDRLLRSKIGGELDARYAKDHHFITPLVRALDGDSSLASIGITRASVMAALPPAVHDAEARFGNSVRAIPGWGDANAAVYAHPLGKQWPLTLLNAPTVPQPGDVFTVFQSKPDFGPSMRFVADLSDWDNSSMLLTLGESGIWSGSHYDDMQHDWVSVAYRPTPYSDAAVAKAAVDTLRLEPATR